MFGLGVESLLLPRITPYKKVTTWGGRFYSFGRSTRTHGRPCVGLLQSENRNNVAGVKRYNIHEFSTGSTRGKGENGDNGEGEVIINDSRYLIVGNVVHYCRGSSDEVFYDVLENAVSLSSGSVSPAELLNLGSIWYASGEFSKPANSKLNSAFVKPVRLNQSSAPLHLKVGDYMRIHFNPRRFPTPPSITVMRSDERMGFMVVDKPRGLPCHPTVDNAKENLVEMMGGEGRYMGLPSRLDTDTRGLIVLASDKKFASYFSRLLRGKTEGEVGVYQQGGGGASNRALVTKLYRACVCVGQEGVGRLEGLKGEVIKHYLKPSIRAPKVFREEKGEDVEGKDWLECKLRVLEVGEVRDVEEGMVVREGTVGVAEVTVELLTGRTHQIRGQLSALGFALVGDQSYFGEGDGEVEEVEGALLALECATLRFPKPTAVKFGEGEYEMSRKRRRAKKRGEMVEEEEYVVERDDEGKVKEWLDFELERRPWV
ncbi:hypothetical protein TrCOL_g2455 [Triparma columacea]|uniref:Pseudouridine synthase RsuA/RluA-like domain-containing protein n=1 Tax=Triparma columacea TaxID=722753 RepID=A0A9W7GEA2_9STRA|nr:hypothetical protein TrCOL_g2455 [Triparma columacea]